MANGPSLLSATPSLLSLLHFSLFLEKKKSPVTPYLNSPGQIFPDTWNLGKNFISFHEVKEKCKQTIWHEYWHDLPQN